MIGFPLSRNRAAVSFSLRVADSRMDRASWLRLITFIPFLGHISTLISIQPGGAGPVSTAGWAGEDYPVATRGGPTMLEIKWVRMEFPAQHHFPGTGSFVARSALQHQHGQWRWPLRQQHLRRP